MSKPSVIEFYSETNTLLARLYAVIVPHVGAIISIRGKTYRVAAVSFAVDNADDDWDIHLRCNVDLEQAD